MIRLRHKLLIHFLRLFDQATVVFCTALFGNAVAERYYFNEVLAILLGLMGSMVLFNHFVRYDVNRFTEFGAQLKSLLRAITTTLILLLALSVLLSFPALGTGSALAVWASAAGMLAASRYIVRELLKYSRRSGMTSRQLLIVGWNDRARELAGRFEHCPELGYRILGFVTTDVNEALQSTPEGWRVCGHLADLQSILRKNPVDELLICLPAEQSSTQIRETLQLGEQLGIVVRFIADAEQDALLRRMHLEVFDGRLVLTFFRESLLFQLMLKRLMDVTAAAILLTVLSPLLLLVALIIKITSPGPVLYVQERMAMNRRRFKLYKFRSMALDADRRRHEFAHLNEMDGPVFKIKNDPRVTPFGRFIRKTSIDELPQLFNVLSGTMSLVGPRPPLPSEVEQYEWLFQRRLSIKPGITCLWQVSGRNKLTFKEWMELDRQYVSNWSFWLDLKILLRTIPVVLAGRGAS